MIKGIADTCFCIDLWNGELLPALQELGIRILIPDVVADELRNPDVQVFLKFESEIVSADSREVRLVEGFANLYRKASIADLFSLAMAKSRGTPLLTNEKYLRTAAFKERVTVRGILWVLDSLETILNGPQLAHSLERIRTLGAHLPADECDCRLAKWKKLDAL